MTRHTATMSELLAAFDNAERFRPARESSVEVKRAQFERAQASGRIVLLDCVQPYDPLGAFAMLLIGSDCGHLIRVPLMLTETAAIVGFMRDQGMIR
jgi:hypothetical protein